MSFVVLGEKILTQANVIGLIADPQQCVMAATQTDGTCAAQKRHRALVSTQPGGGIPGAGSALTHKTHTLITSVSDGLQREGNELQYTMEQRASRRKRPRV